MATRQRLTAQATADLTGAATFTFKGAPNSFDYIGRVSVPGAPAAATFTVVIDDLTELTFFGSNPAGELQLHPTSTMKIEASGLTNGVEYQAVWPVRLVPMGTESITPSAVGGVFNGTVTGTVLADQGLQGTILESWFVELTDGTKVIGVPGSPLRVDFSGNVPVTGEITADQGTPNTLANGWPVKITDGTNVLGTTGHPLDITGLVGTQPEGPQTGQATWASGGPVQLHSGSIPMVNGILVGAFSTNGASVFVGATGVSTTTGVEMPAGAIVPFTCSDVNLLYLLGTNSGDKVWWSVL